MGKVSKVYAVTMYAIGTVLMIFGWFGAEVQGDAADGHPGTSGIVAIFALALALLVPAAMRLWCAKRAFRTLLLPVVGLQALICMYAIVAEYML